MSWSQRPVACLGELDIAVVAKLIHTPAYCDCMMHYNKNWHVPPKGSLARRTPHTLRSGHLRIMGAKVGSGECIWGGGALIWGPRGRVIFRDP